MNDLPDLRPLGRQTNTTRNASDWAGDLCTGAVMGVPASAGRLSKVQGSPASDGHGATGVARKEADQMKTLIQVEIEHSKPLPESVTDALAERAYTLLHNKSVACNVTARLLEVKPEAKKPWEAA